MTTRAAAGRSTRVRLLCQLTGTVVVAAVTMTLVAGNAAAYWTSDSTTGAGGAAATTVNQGATPTASGVGNTVTVNWAASTLANGTAVANYLVTRYDVATQTPQLVCTVTGTTCTDSAAPAGQWVYSVTPRAGTNWLGLESEKSNQVTSDLVAPTNALTVAVVAGNAALSGGTIFYRGLAAGSFRLRNAMTDAGSGPASSTTTPLTSGPTWTHNASSVSTPAGGPYLSDPFTWPAATTSSPTETISGRDVAGNVSSLPLTFVDDSIAPTGGTLSYAAGYQPGPSVQISFTSGTDTGSGIAGRQLQRSAAATSVGVCPVIGSYSAFADVGPLDPASPYVDDQVTTDTCYVYRYVITDLVGNQYIATNTNVAIVSYAGAVSTTVGALSLWRFGESATDLISADKFTAPTGTELSAHTSDTSWTRWAADLNIAVITAQGRVRQNAALTGAASYYTSATPSSPDYSVEADITVKSVLALDDVGIEGRLQLGSSLSGTFYLAQYHLGAFGVAQWQLLRYVNGTPSLLTTAVAQSSAVGQTYRLRLDMAGSTIRMFVNGVVVATASDPSPITPAGRAGIRLGSTAVIVGQSDTTGLQLDNFQLNLSTYPRAADSLSTNTADYKNGVSLGATGALTGSTDAAARFDGLNDYAQAAGTTGLPVGASARSVELWFTTTSSSKQMLFDYGTRATNQKFSLSIDAGGASMTAWAGGAGSDKTFTPAFAVNDGLWHHLVTTYDGTSIRIYVDGVALAPQAAVRATVMDPYGFSIGAALNTLDPNSTAYFDGMIDEVAIYTAVLSQATVTNHHQFGKH